MPQTQLRSRFLFGTLWAFLGQALAVLFGVVSSALLARLVSANDLGIFFLASSFIVIFAAIFQLGLGKAATRMIAGTLAGNDQRRAWMIASTIFLVALISVLAGVALFFYVAFDYAALFILDSDDLASLKLLVLIWGGVFALRTILLDVYRGFHDIRSTVLFGEPVTKLIFSAALAIVWALGINATAETALQIVLFSVLMSFILSGAVLYVRGRKFLQYSLVPIKPILVISIPLMVTNVANMAYGQASIWIVGATQAEQDVAIFGAALRLATLVSTPLLIISAVIPPMIAGMYASKSMQRVEKLLRTSATIAAIPAGILLILFVFFGEEILGLIYGAYYAKAHVLLIVLSVAQFMYVFTGPSALSLAMTDHQNSLMTITGISLVLLVGSGILAGQAYGTIGVAIANASVIFANTAATLFMSRIKIGVWAHASLSCLKVSEFSSTRDLLLGRFKRK